MTRRRKLLLGVVASVLPGLALPGFAGASGGDPVSITDFGAVPDGRTDCTAAIEAAAAIAKMRDLPVLVPRGTYMHRSFSLSGVAMSGEGAASILFAPVSDDSSIFLRGDRPALRNLSVRVKSTRRDVRNPAVFIDKASNFEVLNVSIDGGNAGGILNFGGNNGYIVDNQVRNTLADAIHNTYGTHDIVVSGNIVRNAGDDMIAVVSYGNEVLSHDILIESNDVADQQHGRGISVVGGRNVTIRGNVVARTNCCAGIYIASESAYKTHGVRNVVVQDNHLSDNSGSTGHGAVMLFSDREAVQDIEISHNTIVGARHAAITLLGNVSGVSLIGNQMLRPAERPIEGIAAVTSCVGNRLDAAPLTEGKCGE